MSHFLLVSALLKSQKKSSTSGTILVTTLKQSIEVYLQHLSSNVNDVIKTILDFFI